MTFIVPVVLIYIFGSIFSGGGTVTGIPIALLNQSNSAAAKKIERAIDSTKAFAVIRTYKDDKNNSIPFDTVSIRDYVAKGNASAAIVFPVDAYSDTATAMRIKYYFDPKNEIESQMVQGLLQQAVMQGAPDLLKESMLRRSKKLLGTESGNAFNHNIASLCKQYFDVDTNIILHPLDTLQAKDTNAQEVNKNMNMMESFIQLQSEQVAGNDIANPNVARNIGGCALMFLLFSVTASAASLFDEEKSGIMLRLLTAPVTGADILWSKYIYNILLGVMQLVIMFFVGSFLFRIDILSNFGNLLCVILAGSLACTSIGMLLSAYCKTDSQARGLGTFVILTMSAIGGAWFPIFLMPAFIQHISKLTVVYWSVDGFIQVLWRHASFVDILPNLSFLLGFALVVNIISVLKYRKSRF